MGCIWTLHQYFCSWHVHCHIKIYQVDIRKFTSGKAEKSHTVIVYKIHTTSLPTVPPYILSLHYNNTYGNMIQMKFELISLVKVLWSIELTHFKHADVSHGDAKCEVSADLRTTLCLHTSQTLSLQALVQLGQKMWKRTTKLILHLVPWSSRPDVNVTNARTANGGSLQLGLQFYCQAHTSTIFFSCEEPKSNSYNECVTGLPGYRRWLSVCLLLRICLCTAWRCVH